MAHRDRSASIMMFDCDVHMAAKVATLDDPPQFCSMQLTKSKRSDWARSYDHEVTQRVQAGVDQTSLAQSELLIQFGMPMWVEDENVGDAHLDVPSAEEASQKAHAEVADKDLLDPEDDNNDAVLPQHDWPSPWKSTQVRPLQAGESNEDEPQAGQAP